MFPTTWHLLRLRDHAYPTLPLVFGRNLFTGTRYDYDNLDGHDYGWLFVPSLYQTPIVPRDPYVVRITDQSGSSPRVFDERLVFMPP